MRLELTTAPNILNEKGDNKRTNASKVEGGTCTDNETMVTKELSQTRPEKTKQIILLKKETSIK